MLNPIFLVLLTIFPPIIVGKSFFIGLGSILGDSFATLEDFGEFAKNNADLLVLESDVLLLLKPGSPYKIINRIVYQIPNRLIIKPMTEGTTLAAQASSIIVNSTEEAFYFTKATVSFENIDFYFNFGINSANKKSILMSIIIPRLIIKNCSFRSSPQPNTENGLEGVTLINGIDSYIIMERVVISEFYISNITSLLFLDGTCALSLNDFNVTASTFASASFFLVNNPRDISLSNVNFERNTIKLKRTPFLLGVNVLQIHFTNINFFNNTLQIEGCDFISITLKGNLIYAGIENFKAVENFLEIPYSFLSLQSLDNADLFRLTNLVFENNRNNKTYVFLSDANEIEITNSLWNNNTGGRMLYMEKFNKTSIDKFTCSNSNRNTVYRGDFYSPEHLLGSCAVLIETGEKYLSNIKVLNNSAINTTPGFLIIDKGGKAAKFTLISSVFSGNEMFYNIFGDFSTSLHVLTEVPLIVVSKCLFERNSMNSTKAVLIQVGGPCGVFKTHRSEIYFSDSLLKENESKFHSSCLILIGSKIKVEDTEFSYQKIIYDRYDIANYEPLQTTYPFIEKLAEGNKGSLYISAPFLEVNKCLFTNNRVFRGGIVFEGNWTSNVIVKFFLSNSKFLYNIGSTCVAAFPGTMMSSYYLVVSNSIFLSNKAGSASVFYTLNPYDFSSISLLNCVFTDNYAEFAAVASFEYVDQVILINNTFNENKATYLGSNYPASISAVSIISSGNTLAFFTGNIYQNNWSDVRACVVCFVSFCEFTNEVYIGNVAFDFAGIYANTQAYVIINKCSFSGCKAGNNGGCVTNSLSKMYIYNTIFVDCKAQAKGGMLFGSETLDHVMKNCIIARSSANTGSVISAYLNGYSKGSWIVSDCVFHNNTSDNILFQISETELVLSNSVISRGKTNIFNIDDTDVKFLNTTFFGIDCTLNFFGCVLAGLRSTITFEQTLFNEITNKVDIAGLTIFESQVAVVNSIFYKLSTQMETSGIFTEDFSTLNLSEVLFMTLNKKFVSVSKGHLNLMASIFDNKERRDMVTNSAVFCTDFLGIKIIGSLFKNNFGDFGGALYISSSLALGQAKPEVLITSCTFYNNSAFEGGALYLRIDAGNITKNKFEGNFALDMGGAIMMLNNKGTLKKSISISGNEFTSNNANLGSILKWAWVEPQILNNDMKPGIGDEQNKLVSFPIRLQQKVRKSLESMENLNLLKEISPGLPLELILELKILDTDGDVFLRSDESKFSISIRNNPDYYSKSKENSFLFGESSIRIKNGIIDLSGIMLSGKEDTNYYMFCSLDSITEFFSDYISDDSNTTDIPAHINLRGKYFLRIPIRFRKCRPGEIFIENSLACSPCQYGRYSFDPSIECKKCPEGATCTGGSSLTVKTGFWRSSKTSANIISCEEFAEQCLEDEVGKCSVGYKGPLCGSCQLNYARNNINGCTLCEESLGFTYFKVLLYLSGISVVCILMIKTALKNAKNMRAAAKKMTVASSNTNMNSSSVGFSKGIRSNVVSLEGSVFNKASMITSELADYKAAYYKILVNFIQLVGIIRSLKISWPAYLSNYMNFMKYMSLFSSKLLTLGCFSKQSSDLPFAFTEVLVLNGIFIMFLMIMCIFWVIWGKLFRVKIKRRIFISFLIIYDMIQPTLVSELGNLLICKDIENKFYLSQDTSVTCEDQQYNVIAYGIFLPFLILWSLALPVFLFYLLKRRSHRLFEGSVYSTYGVFYSCYKPEFYFWDFFIMSRENILIYTSLLRINLIVRINIILVLLAFFAYYQITKQPYITQKMNNLEKYALLVSLYMIFLAYNQSLGAEEGYIMFGTILMIILTLLYLGIWVSEYLVFFKKDFGDFINKNSKLIKDIMVKRSNVQKVSPRSSNSSLMIEGA